MKSRDADNGLRCLALHSAGHVERLWSPAPHWRQLVVKMATAATAPVSGNRARNMYLRLDVQYSFCDAPPAAEAPAPAVLPDMFRLYGALCWALYGHIDRSMAMDDSGSKVSLQGQVRDPCMHLGEGSGWDLGVRPASPVASGNSGIWKSGNL